MSETSNPKYVVIVNDSHTRQASLGKRDYSGRHYTVIAGGKYEDIEPLARKLNAEATQVTSGAANAVNVNVDERLAAMTPEEAARRTMERIEKRNPASVVGETAMHVYRDPSDAFEPVNIANRIAETMRNKGKA